MGRAGSSVPLVNCSRLILQLAALILQQAALILQLACKGAVAQMHGSTLLSHFRAMLELPSIATRVSGCCGYTRAASAMHTQTSPRRTTAAACVLLYFRAVLGHWTQASAHQCLLLQHSRMQAMAAQLCAHHLLLQGSCLVAQQGGSRFHLDLTLGAILVGHAPFKVSGLHG